MCNILEHYEECKTYEKVYEETAILSVDILDCRLANQMTFILLPVHLTLLRNFFEAAPRRHRP